MESALVNIRLESKQIEALDKLAGQSLSRQSVARMLLIGAIEAVQNNHGKIHLPPKFAVADDTSFTASAFRINEPKSPRSK